MVSKRMSDADYLSRLAGLKTKSKIDKKQYEQSKEQEKTEEGRRKKFREARDIYKRRVSASGRLKGEHRNPTDRSGYLVIDGRPIYPIHEGYPLEFLERKSQEVIERNKGEIATLAYNLMHNESYSPGDALYGAMLYEKIGKGRRIIPRLLKVIEKATQLPPDYVSHGELTDGFYRRVQSFIERNSGKRKQKEGGLEGRTMVFLGSLLAGIALSAFSLTATGNAIGNLTGTTPGLLGLILFVVGLAGLFFSGKNN